jgi:hypothetical protein
MLILSETTDTLEAVLGGAITTNQARCMTSWRDITDTTYVPGRTLINTNSTTAVTIAGAPASSTRRVIDFLSVYNYDTVSITLTIRFNANSTQYILWYGVLAPNERLEYIEGAGFRVTAANGLEKTLTAQTTAVTGPESTVVLSSDVTNSNSVANTIADVTGLSFPVTAAETYWFKFVIPYTAAATTTGSRWSINGPASPTLLAFTSQYSLTTTSFTFNTGITYDAPSASNASSASATGLTSANTAIIEGIIKPSASGTVIARFASKVASSAIVAKAGAFLRYRRIA